MVDFGTSKKVEVREGCMSVSTGSLKGVDGSSGLLASFKRPMDIPG